MAAWVTDEDITWGFEQNWNRNFVCDCPKGSRSIFDEPPSNCPYLLEHVLVSQKP